MSELYIGLMSGTSADGIDAALVDFSEPKPRLVGSFYQEYPKELRQDILALCQPGSNEINRLGKLDVTLGKAFADAIHHLLKKYSISSHAIHAIGSHGQTIRHHPDRHFTLQIGDPNIISAKTGITTVADFRRRDMAHGGQGAPLVPAFHQAVFAKKGINRAIVNIGGIANVTLLLSDGTILGFDTGPGNTLLDAWIEKNLQKSCDKNGDWAARGQINKNLLNQLLSDPFFTLSPPKSTGREYFNLAWLQKKLQNSISEIDIQTTLVALTAISILNSINQYMTSGEILICGGGIHNAFLMSRLKNLGNNFLIDSTEKWGIHPDWVEAMAFAWLAKQTLDKKPGSITAVTGATQTAILGGIYYSS